MFPSLGALTDADLDKIRLIVKDEVKSEINASEKRMKEYINTKNESIDDKFESIEKNFDRQNNIIIACIGIPLAIFLLLVQRCGVSWHTDAAEKTAPLKKK
ncbi:MAG: hypothetical protein OXG88_00175 [Gammaproteobacteria bacterium]|nr:hypothetical protein [Gammaproteobacteria bacterium]